jgi:hypothetical protein
MTGKKIKSYKYRHKRDMIIYKFKKKLTYTLIQTFLNQANMALYFAYSTISANSWKKTMVFKFLFKLYSFLY